MHAVHSGCAVSFGLRGLPDLGMMRLQAAQRSRSCDEILGSGVLYSRCAQAAGYARCTQLSDPKAVILCKKSFKCKEDKISPGIQAVPMFCS
eukprot:63671-Amphidinium_carterae.1